MNWKSSKAQIPQMFIFLAALFVIGATIFIGTRLFVGLESTACSANDASFQQELKALLDDRATYGWRDEVILRTPCDAIQLCFVDNSAIGDDAFGGNPPSGDGVIVGAVRTGVKTTVFLRDWDKTSPAAYDDRVKLSDPAQPLCIDAVSGRFRFTTEGYGRYVLIRPPPDRP